MLSNPVGMGCEKSHVQLHKGELEREAVACLLKVGSYTLHIKFRFDI